MSNDTTGGAGGTSPLSGKTLGGRWKVEGPICSGSLGSLLRATDAKDSSPVAIRVPGGALLAETDLTVRWADGVKALTTIDHTNLVKTLGGGLEDGTPWAAVRFVGGGSLEDLTASRAGRPSAADVSTWLGRIAGALDTLHGAGIVHRGVRPSAILFDAAGQPFLADATIGKALDASETNALATVMSSAAANYLAPEASTPPGTAGPAFDQYSLAVVAYEALSGKLPFHGQTGAAAAVVRQAKAAQPLLEVAPGVPPEAAAAVMKALERLPASRHPSCAAFAKAFAAGVSSAPAAAGGGAGAAGSETRFAAGRGPAAVTPAAAAPAKSDPNATRIIPKAGAKKGPDVALPTGAAPRKSGSTKTLVTLLLVLTGAAAAAAFFLRSEEAPEKPVTIEITSPQEGVMVTSPDVLVRGNFTSPRKSDVVKVEGVEVMPTDGKFERLVSLSQEGKHKIAVTVESNGKVRKRVDWIVTYNAIWRPFVEEAKRLADAGNLPAAKEKLAVAKAKGATEKDLLPDVVAAIARYEAPPSLAITAPADGAKLDKPKVVVEGTFASGRPSDKVYVDGAEVAVEEGRFKREVAVPEGEREIVVTVRDGETARKTASVKVTYVYVRPVEAWEAWLSTWATADGAARDATTGYPSRVIRKKDGGAMVLVPAGEFWMGSTKDAKTVLEGEKPGHKVTISKAYYMDETPVTLAQWKKYVESGEGRLPNLAFKETKDEMPIYNVTHLEATTFSRWAGVFLPTEAQWERAAKGGDDELVFPWGTADDQAKRNAEGPSDGFEQWAPAKAFAANAYGLYGMAGNVWQWCADWYDPKYYVASERTDPAGPAEGTMKALRGGGWDSPAFKLRVCHRHAFDPKFTDRTIGFRCVRSLP